MTLGEELWDLEYLEIDKTARDFISFQETLNDLIISAVRVPSWVFESSVRGSYALAKYPFPTTQRIRDIVRTKAYFIDTQHPDLPTILSILNGERNRYVYSLNGGLRTYIAEMLGPLVSATCNTCRVFGEDKAEISIPSSFSLMAIQRYLVEVYTVSTLPYKVKFEGEVERYL